MFWHFRSYCDITRQLPEFDVQLPYLIQSGSTVHYTKLVYPNLCLKLAEQVHFQRSASARAEKSHKPIARKSPANHTVNIKLIKDRVYDLCMRKFRESAVEPIQKFCREIKSPYQPVDSSFYWSYQQP